MKLCSLLAAAPWSHPNGTEAAEGCPQAFITWPSVVFTLSWALSKILSINLSKWMELQHNAKDNSLLKYTHINTCLKTKALHPPRLAVQLSTKPEWIRAVLTSKPTLTAHTWLSTSEKWWDSHWVWMVINHRKAAACFMEALLDFNQVYFEESTGLVIPWADNPPPAPNTAGPLNQPHCTVLQNVRGEFNTHTPIKAGAAEGNALLMPFLSRFWKSNSFVPIIIS